MLFICYPKCSTCQKAKKWLDEHKKEYTERHIVEDNPTYEELKEWYLKSGIPLKKFFNTSGLLYKEMQLKDKLSAMSEEEQLKLLATNGMLVKRPLIITEDVVLVGFKEEEYTKACEMKCLQNSIFEYRKATLADIDELVRTRLIVLRAANQLSEDADMENVGQESFAYYKRALETGEHIAYLVYDNGTFIGAGGVSFYQIMPTYHNPSGKKAYIMNMYTAPEYRRQGIALHTLDLLVNAVKEQGVSQIALEATDMGQLLYEKYGFVKLETEMGMNV